ncbi:helix-turn-helix domain-containing protein [Herbiconiux sp. YIM B11900]|uniref:helix-turn-helix domain-containing protein n=1 Tax=Herbiconiux sp. YIM B11900 TaxID=3404131 RepID=UPI003F870928
MTVVRTEPDAVGALLARLRFRADSPALERLAPGERRRRSEGAVLHHVVSGSASVSGTGACAIVRAGDVFLLPLGGPHSLTAIEEAELLTIALRVDGAAPAAVLEGGLPELMMSCALAERSAVVAGLIGGIREELAAGRDESASLADGLATLVVTATLRGWAESGCDRDSGASGWQLALRDPHIARALEAIQNEPGTKWSVAALARVANSSRSVFAEQFRLAVGVPPLAYLARVRMERAKQLLTEGGFSVGQAANALGYCSDEAFSRAFRRVSGETPTAWRRSAVADPSVRPAFELP